MARVAQRTKPKRPRKKRGPVRRLLRAIWLLGFYGFVIVNLWVLLYRIVDPPGGIYMASESARLGGVAHDWTAIEAIAPAMARSAMAAEDAQFCDHNGFDLQAIRAAMAANERGGRTIGGSTISQQVAKNVFLWHQRSWLRKGLEAGFTVLIELYWPKKRILEVYLNMAEFAPGVFGVEAGARHHFGRSAARLNLTQASRLAAVLPGPKTRNAGKPSSSVRQRGRRIAAGAQTLKAEGRDKCAFD